MANVRLILGDCLDVLPTLEAGSVDAVVTDPPYGLRGQVVRGAGRIVEAMPAWDVSDNLRWLPAIVPLLRSDASVLAFTDSKRVGEMWNAMGEVRLKPKQIICWVKHAPPPNPRKCFQSVVETAVWAIQGGGVWNGRGLTPNAVWYEGPHKGKRSHPAEKPVALMQWLVSLFCPEGGTVLDCFAGSGTTGVACVKQGFGFIGIEREAEYLAIAEKRIAAAGQAMPLFAKATE